VRPWNVAALTAAALGLTAMALIILARWAGIRVEGLGIVYDGSIQELIGVGFLFLLSATLLLAGAVSDLRSRLPQADRLVPRSRASAGRPSRDAISGPDEDVEPGPLSSPPPEPTAPRRNRVGEPLRLAGVSKRYELGPVQVSALRDVSLDIAPASLTVILGPSGSGKTTLLNLLGGIDRATSGEIWVDGTEVSKLDEAGLLGYRRDRVGFVFQFFNLIPSLTARENVALAAELVANPASAEEVLRQVGLGERMEHFPAELSGGEQQRVAIARALVKDPPLLLCDEPTGELDYATGVRVLRILRDAARRDGRAVIVVTHNAVIGEMADLVVRLRGGQIDQITANPEPADPESLRW